METKLYLGFNPRHKYSDRIGEWYLSDAGLEEAQYFRQGCGVLYDQAPTYFVTKDEAIKAAQNMGFTVVVKGKYL